MEVSARDFTMTMHSRLASFGQRRILSGAQVRRADAVGLAAATVAGLLASAVLKSWIVPDPVLVFAHIAFFFTALFAADDLERLLSARRIGNPGLRRIVAMTASGGLTAAFLVVLLALTGSGEGAAGELGRLLFDAQSLMISLALVVPALAVTRRLMPRTALQERTPGKVAQQDSERLSLIFHELRRSLTTLVSASELAMERDITDGERRQLVSTIYRRSMDLSGFLEDFIEAARVQSGTIKLNVRTVDVSRLIGDIAEEFGGPRQSHTVQAMGSPSLMATLDDGKLRIILKNLVSNAIAYSPRGSTVQVRFHLDQRSLVLEVEDEGPGVPDDCREQVFQQFFRAPGTSTRGFGLGLYLVRQLVIAQGGAVTLTQAEPHGARFTVVLPTGVPQAEASPRGSSSGSSPSAGSQRQSEPARTKPLSRGGTAELPGDSATP